MVTEGVVATGLLACEFKMCGGSIASEDDGLDAVGVGGFTYDTS